ncbi:hypothetical protein SAMN02799631_03845 [Methylobacterium sp. 174MFSha1.1]|uniref:hypothetical protein n=1 Tax=Methylobacterium sp. 174MFSha1.1 TaxID=1502749 RepID=UPI0008F2EE0B|nr:hypothetical protein [Methylobacterium sp. 174MFSha1.1]SFV01642.1 hypothetical protein SAMN02799631_03845 [Methylobacterium sp. 174MFSha1.1]
MGEAALGISGQERSGPDLKERSGPDLKGRTGPDFDLVRRLLLPPGWLGPRPYRLPLPDEEEIEEIDDLVAQLEAENKVMKAVLRSEREAAAELRAQVAALSIQQAQDEDTQEDLRADRDRWASLVERLLFAPR